MGSLSMSLKIRLILFLLGVWAIPAPPAKAQDQTFTGWFTFIVADTGGASLERSELALPVSIPCAEATPPYSRSGR